MASVMTPYHDGEDDDDNGADPEEDERANVTATVLRTMPAVVFHGGGRVDAGDAMTMGIERRR